MLRLVPDVAVLPAVALPAVVLLAVLLLAVLLLAAVVVIVCLVVCQRRPALVVTEKIVLRDTQE